MDRTESTPHENDPAASTTDAKPLVNAATVIPVCDTADGLKVLLLRRHPSMRFAGGMWVFPGGKIDPIDRREDDRDPDAAAARAALRETNEEAGIDLNAESLVWFSHWTPPSQSPSRFLTTFFVTVCDDELAVHIDGNEIVDHVWITPQDALRRRDLGDFELSPPTWITLYDLSLSERCADLVERIQQRSPEFFATRIEMTENGYLAAVYHGDIAYESAPAPSVKRALANLVDPDDQAPHAPGLSAPRALIVGPRHRLDMTTTPWTYERDESTRLRRIAGSDVEIPPPTLLVATPTGRRIAVDVVSNGEIESAGSDSGHDVVYFHGTPDTRLARGPAPDAAGHGHRLIAWDRPGLGDSDIDPHASPNSVADDMIHVLDALGVDRVGIFGWSAGALFALAAASRHPERVTGVVLAGPLAPVESLADPNVGAAAGAERRSFAELVNEMGPQTAAEAMAPYLVPERPSLAVARSVILDEDNPSRVAEISSAPGAADALISALAATTQQGFAGLEREIAAQCASIGFDRIACPVRIYVGRDDLVCPPAMAHWLAARIDNATVTETDGGHFFALRDWANLISLAADLR